MEFHKGDLLTVTGDSAQEAHQFDPGDEVVVNEKYEAPAGNGKGLYYCSLADYVGPKEDVDEVSWWVNEVDLVPIEVDPKEVERAVKSILRRET